MKDFNLYIPTKKPASNKLIIKWNMAERTCREQQIGQRYTLILLIY